MTRRVGGTKVEPGFYWNPASWQIVTIEKQAQALPGGPDQKYVKVPLAGMLVLTPLLGLSFVVFLPFAGFAMVGGLLGRKAVQGVRHAAAMLWPEAEEPKARTEERASRRKKA
jgi:hypothetical protein